MRRSKAHGGHESSLQAGMARSRSRNDAVAPSKSIDALSEGIGIVQKRPLAGMGGAKSWSWFCIRDGPDNRSTDPLKMYSQMKPKLPVYSWLSSPIYLPCMIPMSAMKGYRVLLPVFVSVAIPIPKIRESVSNPSKSVICEGSSSVARSPPGFGG